jgi:predicted nucleotidyltransferase
MLTSTEVEKKLRELKPVLSEKYFVDKIGYFGSFARDQQNDDSDIDILVELSKPIGWDFFTMEAFLEQTFNRKVDLITKSALKEQLRDKILHEVKYV